MAGAIRTLHDDPARRLAMGRRNDSRRVNSCGDELVANELDALLRQLEVVIGVAALVYLIGCFGVTVVFNVPLNETLAGMDLTSDATRDYWSQTYVPRWTFWNSVRTGAAALASALLLFGLLWMIQGQVRQV